MGAKDELKDELGLLSAWQLSEMSCGKLYHEKERLKLGVFRQVAKINHEYKAMLENYVSLVTQYQTKNCYKNKSEGEGACKHCDNLNRNL